MKFSWALKAMPGGSNASTFQAQTLSPSSGFLNQNPEFGQPFSLFHHAIFNSIMDKTPTHALFTQHCISLAC